MPERTNKTPALSKVDFQVMKHVGRRASFEYHDGTQVSMLVKSFNLATGKVILEPEPGYELVQTSEAFRSVSPYGLTLDKRQK